MNNFFGTQEESSINYLTHLTTALAEAETEADRHFNALAEDVYRLGLRAVMSSARHLSSEQRDRIMAQVNAESRHGR